jgi:hypothetical protein
VSALDKFFADLGVAVMHGDTVKVEIMKEAMNRARRAAGCPTGDPFMMTTEELANLYPSPEFVQQAAAEMVRERCGGRSSERDARIVDVLTRYLP